MLSAINGFQEQVILDSYAVGPQVRIDPAIHPFDEVIPENENDRILREKFKKWRNVFPGMVSRADTLLSKAE